MHTRLEKEISQSMKELKKKEAKKNHPHTHPLKSQIGHD